MQAKYHPSMIHCMLDVQVAGARWQGTKTRLEESEDEEPQQAPDQDAVPQQQLGRDGPGDSEDCSEDTHVSSRGGGDVEPSVQEAVSGRRAKKERGGSSGAKGGAGAGRKLLRKLARSVLHAAGGRIRLKKLEKRVLDAAGFLRGSAERKQARAALARVMQGKNARVALEGHDAVSTA